MFKHIGMGKTRAGNRAQQLADAFDINSSELANAHFELNGANQKRGLAAQALLYTSSGVLVLESVYSAPLWTVAPATVSAAVGTCLLARQILSTRNGWRNNLRRDRAVVERAVRNVMRQRAAPQLAPR